MESYELGKVSTTFRRDCQNVNAYNWCKFSKFYRFNMCSDCLFFLEKEVSEECQEEEVEE